MSARENRPSGGATETVPELTNQSTPVAPEDVEKVLSENHPMWSTQTPLPEILRGVTEAWMRSWDGVRPAADELLLLMNGRILALNEEGKYTSKHLANLPRQDSLAAPQLAQLLGRAHRLVLVAGRESAEKDRALLPLMRYITEGPLSGIYQPVSDIELRRLCSGLGATPTERVVVELRAQLQAQLPIVHRCMDPDLVPVANGVFNYRTRQLVDFTPEVVFTSKAVTRYVPDAPKPTIVQDDNTVWDPEEWMASIAPGDEEIELLLWQVLGALVRPLVPWNKWVMLHSEQGNNGKGTYVKLARELIGEDAWVSKPLEDFGRDFPDIEDLNTTSAVLTDENNDVYLGKTATLKALITGDPVSVARKNQRDVQVTFRGVMVQCLNSMPKAKDRTDAFYRRMLPVPMRAWFKETENTAVKEDYVTRADVREWVLHHVLVELDPYDTFIMPAASTDLLGEVRADSDPVLEFWQELGDELVWDLLPVPFLVDLFQAWHRRARSAGHCPNQRQVSRDLKRLISDEEWEFSECARPNGRMDAFEHLTVEYQLHNWNRFPPNAGNAPRWGKENYRGFVRRTPRAHPPGAPLPPDLAYGLSASSDSTTAPDNNERNPS